LIPVGPGVVERVVIGSTKYRNISITFYSRYNTHSTVATKNVNCVI